MNVDPRGMRDAQDWVNSTTWALSRLMGQVPVLRDNLMWVDWAYNVVQNPAIQKYVPPDPRYFTKWQEWALMFNQVVPL